MAQDGRKKGPRTGSPGRPIRRIAALGLGLLLLAATGCTLRPGASAEPDAPSTAEPAPRIDFPRPASHRGDWRAFHGKTVGTLLEAPEGEPNCTVCHRRTDCVECHNTAKPADHNHAWRTRTHGFYAAGDRERCLVCHRQDYCVSCHQQTAPRTHVGAWRDRHCDWCHFDAGLRIDANCRVCHRAAPHASAPHDLAGREDCAACHG